MTRQSSIPTDQNTLTPAPESASSSSYLGALSKAMKWLSYIPETIFLGQGVRDPGTFMSQTLEDVPLGKRIEFPVAEEMQMGASIGLALAGRLPITIYPRWNFLILATNQVVNHFDKMGVPVIVRVGVGAAKPLYPGLQHVGDFTDAFKAMCPNTHVTCLKTPDQVLPAYRKAAERNGPSILVEYGELYNAD